MNINYTVCNIFADIYIAMKMIDELPYAVNDFTKFVNVLSLSRSSIPMPLRIEGKGVFIVRITRPVSTQTLLSGIIIWIVMTEDGASPLLVLIKIPFSDISLDIPVLL